ncbi:hypothetical protein AWC38_SpisGene23852 [Stylophora pistillata]|uniref:Tyr recombinase domain-containing protein n=1 Tax=Stylophora pistillata TaxID=50429 RepID=A0A2B4R758_STYPI|nr:hypothetical protein AWC38_SpisGene23852 [Stylophora pistillata]
MTESQLAENGAAPSNSKLAIVAAISSMSKLLVSSITSLKFTMTESLGQMKDTIDHLAIEEGSLEENAETEEQLEIAAYMDQRSTQQSDKNQQSGSAVSNSGAKKPTSSQTTEQSINTLINQSSESQRDVPDGEIDLLSGIANDLKLDQKKAPAINEQIAKIVHGLMREKLTDEVLTATQNRYNTPENCECLTSTKKPHKRASRDTIRRWIQQMMLKAGISINVYKPYSTCSAAASKAKVNNASLAEIMQTAGWSSAATFARFYDGEIEQGSSFTNRVLSLS